MKFVFLAFILFLPTLSFADPSCPGWIPVPLEWDKTVKEFCYQFGSNCRALASANERGVNVSHFDPVYGDYDDLLLVNLQSKKEYEEYVWKANHIQCEEYLPSAEDINAKASDEQSAKECTEAGGIWDRQSGRGHVTGCNLPTIDGGKDCTDSKECQGGCVRGKCYGYRMYKGCGIIHNGQEMCIE